MLAQNRIEQSCSDGILLLGVTGCSIVGGEGNTKCVKALCSILYASRWIAMEKGATSCKHRCLLALTFRAEVSGGQWSCLVARACDRFLAGGKRWESLSIYHPEKEVCLFAPVLTETRT